MKKVLIWFYISCKRYLKKTAFLLLLLLFPVISLWISALEKEPFDGVQIGVFAQGDELSREVLDRLLEKNGMIRFYACESREELLKDTASRKAECGFVLPENLEEMLEQKEYRRSILVYRTASTVMDGFAKEAVTAAVMECYGGEILTGYLTEANLFEEQVLDLYETYLSDGSTFHFESRTESGELETGEELVVRVFPLKGLIAVYLMAAGLFAAARGKEDEEKGLFLPLPYEGRWKCMAAAGFAPVFLAALSCLAALAVSGELTGRGALALNFYAALSWGYGFLLQRILRKPAALYSVIPFLILGSVVFCPVFLDLAKWIPGGEKIRYFFLPWYYFLFS